MDGQDAQDERHEAGGVLRDVCEGEYEVDAEAAQGGGLIGRYGIMGATRPALLKVW